MEVLTELLLFFNIVVSKSKVSKSKPKSPHGHLTPCKYVPMYMHKDGLSVYEGVPCELPLSQGQFCTYHSVVHNLCYRGYKQFGISFFGLILRIGHAFCFYGEMDRGHMDFIVNNYSKFLAKAFSDSDLKKIMGFTSKKYPTKNKKTKLGLF